MKIILSPAKKMGQDKDFLPAEGKPKYLSKSQKVLDYLKSMTLEELQNLWQCNEKIAAQNFERLQVMNLQNCLTPAVLSYEGIAFQYMAPSVFEKDQLAYIQKHLCILSAFYGVLCPMDGICPYRLEMQAKARIEGCKDLYEFWGRDLYDGVGDRTIINLASKEYSRCVEKYLTKEDTFITCFFGENVKGKLVQKSTFAKMARGEMVRYMAENHLEDPEQMKNFNRLNFSFREDLSSDREYVFERKE